MRAGVHIVYRHRGPRVAADPLSRVIRRAAKTLGVGEPCGDVTIALIGDREMADLNRRFRGVERTTDVLAFPSGDEPGYLGDIAISWPTARRQARERGHSVSREVKVLALHGWLHLLGYDHETDNGTMMRTQRRLERKLLGARGGGER